MKSSSAAFFPLSSGARSAPRSSAKLSGRKPSSLASRREGLIRVGLGLIAPALILAAWNVALWLDLVSPQVLPPIDAILANLLDLARSDDLANHVLVSFRRVALGFAAGASLGLLFGGAMGLSRGFDRLMRPTFMIIAQIPVLGWLPILMLLLGIGEAAKLVLIAKASFVPVALTTLNGIRDVPPALVEVTRIYRFTRWQLIRKVIAPATLPPVFTGLRSGLTQAWLSLVAVELLASTEGLGYLMVWSRQLFQLDVMVAVMIVIGAIGFTMDRLLSGGEALLRRRYGQLGGGGKD